MQSNTASRKKKKKKAKTEENNFFFLKPNISTYPPPQPQKASYSCLTLLGFQANTIAYSPLSSAISPCRNISHFWCVNTAHGSLTSEGAQLSDRLHMTSGRGRQPGTFADRSFIYMVLLYQQPQGSPSLQGSLAAAPPPPLTGPHRAEAGSSP